MAPSRHDLKIVDWDVKQNKQSKDLDNHFNKPYKSCAHNYENGDMFVFFLFFVVVFLRPPWLSG